jgi:Nitroreductase family
MNRRKFLGIAGVTIAGAGGATYLLSDNSNFVRSDSKVDSNITFSFQADEKEILYLASLAPSGHNTQPWFVKYLEPYHWIIGNDKSKWLPAVDPTQRETILSIGAFIQNLEFAANHAGYLCQFHLLAATNQDENMLEVRLQKTTAVSNYDISKIKNRRTVRSGYLNDELKKEDISYLMENENEFFYFLPNSSKEYNWLNEQTIQANRLQAYRDNAQKELSEWIRFSSSAAKKHCDGLTTAGMELDGIPAWVLRNFYEQKDVMTNKFREQGIDKIKKQVSQSAGWFIITSKDNSVEKLLETGKRFQRMFLKVREKNIAIHPMTQILEEAETKKQVNTSIGISDEIQFILRTGYLKKYPEPVTLRRPVNRFVKK